MKEENYQSENFMSLRKFSDIKLPVDMNTPKKRVQIVETRLIRKTSMLYDRRTICNPAMSAELGRLLFESYDKEYLYAVYLSGKSEPIAVELLSIGTLDVTIFSAKDILKTALLCSANGFILYHNHPSGGDIYPSKEDINATKRINEVSKLMGIRLVDHIIMSDIGYVSLKERGMI